MTDGLIGLGALLLAWSLVMWLKPTPFPATWLVLVATALPMMLRELARAPTPSHRRTDKSRPLLWLIGFTVATAPMMLVHAQGAGLLVWLAAWIVTLPAFALRWSMEHRRGRLAFLSGWPLTVGRALWLRDWDEMRRGAAPARLWLLKAFFIPIYAASLLALMAVSLKSDLRTPLTWLVQAVTLAYTIDLAFGLAGYIFASDALAPTVKSTQPRPWGWIVCLLCYAPAFKHWGDFERVVHGEITWPASVTPHASTIVAAVLMMILLGTYISATLVFGLRFSNLSNRGVITSGPYRYMKHPAYFAHVGNAWIITFLILPATGIELTASHILVPVAFTVLYRCRAVTEETHLREDERYVAYADWIARYGLVGRLRHLLVRTMTGCQQLISG